MIFILFVGVKNKYNLRARLRVSILCLVFYENRDKLSSDRTDRPNALGLQEPHKLLTNCKHLGQ